MFRFVVILVMLFAFPAFADYEINLSVLDSLGPSDVTEELPLPIVKPTPRRAKPRTKVEKQSSKVEQKSQPSIKEETTSEKLPDMVSATEPSTQDKTKVSDADTKSDIGSTEQPNITYDFDSEDNTKEENTISETSEAKDYNSQEEIVIHVPVEPLVPITPKSLESQSSQNNTDNKTDEISFIPLDNLGTSRDSETSTLVTFDDQSDRLTDDVVALLDEFVEKNKENANDKVLIESYHYSSGENAFARKRTSLNRAVNVRSYLLSKGFKSFGIQIINTEEEVMQNNVVVSR